jgi:hypothetical protein
VKYLLHYFNHAGFLSLDEIEADTVDDAAYKQMLARHSFLSEEGATPHTWGTRRREGNWIDVLVYAKEQHPTAFGVIPKGGYWFNSHHRVGESDDCRKCGGTGGNRYTNFVTQCWSCGDGKSKGRSSGKRREAGQHE